MAGICEEGYTHRCDHYVEEEIAQVAFPWLTVVLRDVELHHGTAGLPRESMPAPHSQALVVIA